MTLRLQSQLNPSCSEREPMSLDSGTISLRPYQQDAIDQMRQLMKQGCRSILYQGATGSGKTALTAHMLHTAAS